MSAPRSIEEAARQAMRRVAFLWVRREWGEHGAEFESVQVFAQAYAALVPKNYRHRDHQPVEVSADEIAQALQEGAA